MHYKRQIKLVFILTLTFLTLIFTSLMLNFFNTKNKSEINKRELFKQNTIKLHKFSEKNYYSKFYESDTLFLLDYFVNDIEYKNGKWISSQDKFKILNIYEIQDLIKENIIVENEDYFIISNKFLIINNYSFVENIYLSKKLIIENSILIFNDNFSFVTNEKELFIKKTITNANFQFFSEINIFNSSVNLSYLNSNSEFNLNNNFELIIMEEENNFPTGFYDKVWSYITFT